MDGMDGMMLWRLVIYSGRAAFNSATGSIEQRPVGKGREVALVEMLLIRRRQLHDF
jgi:hypothetical protein